MAARPGFTRSGAITRGDGESSWISVSDLMAGLMMVFLCIAVAMMRSVMIEREKIRTIAMSYKENQLAIYESLQQEFAPDLARWGATIDRDTLTVAFNNSDAMFDTGEAALSASYQVVFEEFFPRYMNVLVPYQDSVDAVRIEGHTSSGWGESLDLNAMYFNNLRLSQDRARSVLRFVYTLGEVTTHHAWMMQNVAAVGYSSSRPIYNADGSENIEQSKRVAFRVITNSETKIHSILEESF
ncbi:OmpA/MotB family protein [Microbulbifer agarilyticus]|uniref:OmpA/MotB family protein n=1 Tax=Microbulbifer agarilyticus TaxID=260552 RepID=UPI001CD75B9C|nr:OmpA family protein [Microbulbifer agarilyticus]MCA0894587.1 OmpA family protein [Microbulbifer agarilyticus]